MLFQSKNLVITGKGGLVNAVSEVVHSVVKGNLQLIQSTDSAVVVTQILHDNAFLGVSPLKNLVKSISMGRFPAAKADVARPLIQLLMISSV